MNMLQSTLDMSNTLAV